MKCSRCGVEDTAATDDQVDEVALLTNGLSRSRHARLCRGCRSVLLSAWDRATTPVGLGAGL